MSAPGDGADGGDAVGGASPQDQAADDGATGSHAGGDGATRAEGARGAEAAPPPGTSPADAPPLVERADRAPGSPGDGASAGPRAEGLIERVIGFSVRERLLVLLATAAFAAVGVWAMVRAPIDALPDLSEKQVVVFTAWEGHAPQEVEDQVTYPLSVALQGLAGVRAVRSTSELGYSMVQVIFEDGVPLYFARERVLERLSSATAGLPAGAVPTLATDSNALGQILWYVLEAEPGHGHDLGALRSLQDWFVRYQLASVPGVAEVGSVGGFVQAWQLDVDPVRLRAHGVTLAQVLDAVARGNGAVGGNVIEQGRGEVLVRGVGWLRDRRDLEEIVVAGRGGVPVYVRQVARVSVGPEPRRSILERDGGEAVGGVVVMRAGEHPLAVTERVLRKVEALQAGLPPGVRVVPVYDRVALIEGAVATLRRTLLEEALVASLMVLLVLRHARSAFVICVTLPLAVLASFLLMRLFGVSANIMSLSGIAISIGVLLDAGIVMTENAYGRLHEAARGGPVTGDTRAVVAEACKAVGRPLFFSVAIMLVSFLPVFALEGQEGKLFVPLALTKTFALLGVAVLAVTVVPALIPLLVRGRLRTEEESWVVRSVLEVYRPMLVFFLDRPRWVGLGLAVLVGLGLRVAPGIGTEFMPPLDEGSIMDMPVTLPSVSTTQAADDLAHRDALLRGLPEVDEVLGKAGRADTPTDPAPLDMVETIVTLRPREHWPRRALADPHALEPRAAAALARLRAATPPGPGAPAAVGAPDDLDAGLLATEAAAAFDRATRTLCRQRFAELEEDLGPLLVAGLVDDLVALAPGPLATSGRGHAHPRAGGAPAGSGPPGAEAAGPASTGAAARGASIAASVAAVASPLAPRWGPRLARRPLRWEVGALAREAAAALVARGLAADPGALLDRPPGWADRLAAPLRALLDRPRPDATDELLARTVARRDALVRARVRDLDHELERAAPALAAAAVDVALGDALRARGLAPPAGDARPGAAAGAPLALRRKTKADLVAELDQAVQVPGWANIWTQPIINRVDMLATGVRTQLGVKVFGDDLDAIQRAADDVARVLREVPGAADVFPDQLAGERYLEATVDRARAARSGVSAGDVQDAVEVALGGRVVTTTIDGRRRVPVRVRYPRDDRQDPRAVSRVLVTAGMAGGMPAPPASPGPGEPASVPGLAGGAVEGAGQVPLAEVADVRLVTGPSMIKSENGLLRAYVQLNVRGRDLAGFVEEARRVVSERVALPAGTYLEWSGQFEHQERAQARLSLLVPLVVALILVILYLTYGDLRDAAMMLLAVPGALIGGLLFQWLFDFPFSVAVWIGYIACFGLATETGIIMLVYLREAVARRGGLAGIGSEEELRAAVLEGACLRLRPKLLTEGTTILGLVPMLLADGVGAEVMRPMAAPVLGGILVADEVIDVFLPVLFFLDRRARWRRMKKSGGEGGA